MFFFKKKPWVCKAAFKTLTHLNLLIADAQYLLDVKFWSTTPDQPADD